jgi:putative membrane protein
MMYGWNGDGGIWGLLLMTIMMLLFWGGIAALVLLVIRSVRAGSGGYGVSGRDDPGLRHDDPDRILAQRFARGEIDETEFRTRRDALRHKP